MGTQTRLSADWLVLQQLLDTALPIGGFAHSFGLEMLVQEGHIRNGAQLAVFAEEMLRHAWAPGDAMVIKAAYRDVPEGNWTRLWHVERIVHSQRLASETRSGLEKMGRRLLQLAAQLYPQLPLEPLKAALRQGSCAGTHPLVFGVLCCLLQVEEERAAQGYLYSCVMHTLNSALRLLPVGQTEMQVLAARLLPVIPDVWEEVRPQLPEDAWTHMPQLELAMIRHADAEARLFMS